MSDATWNKISAQIIKAEMLGDLEKVDELKLELEKLKNTSNDASKSLINPIITKHSNSSPEHHGDRRDWKKPRVSSSPGCSHAPRGHQGGRVEAFLRNTGSLGQMFEQEKKLTCSDEVKMYMKISGKFSREDMETKYFSSEIDNSQEILIKTKRHKPDKPSSRDISKNSLPPSDSLDTCSSCQSNLARHLMVHSKEFVFIGLPVSKPFLSTKSNVYISNRKHGNPCFVQADIRSQIECEQYIDVLRALWKSEGYRCIIMETYFRDRRYDRAEFVSCGNHFRIHCLPVKEKHYERARISFKQALQECEQEWSMNRKLITIEDQRLQRYLPKGLSYFWVCFDNLKSGFAHVIENEKNFSRFFGLEILSGLMDKDFNPLRANEKDSFHEAFERSRDFKLAFMNYIERHQED